MKRRSAAASSGGVQLGSGRFAFFVAQSATEAAGECVRLRLCVRGCVN